MTIAIDIAVEAEPWTHVAGLDALVHRSVEAALAEAGFVARGEAEVSVLFCDDAAIRVLNRDWRHKDTATNVLSFPADAGPPDAPRMLGDIAVAFETVEREALSEGKTLTDHLAHLLVHGVLHLLGYDHETAADATGMEQLERRILARLGIADPYAGSVPLEAETA